MSDHLQEVDLWTWLGRVHLRLADVGGANPMLRHRFIGLASQLARVEKWSSS